jgi:hypothetical protein
LIERPIGAGIQIKAGTAALLEIGVAGHPEHSSVVLTQDRGWKEHLPTLISGHGRHLKTKPLVASHAAGHHDTLQIELASRP